MSNVLLAHAVVVFTMSILSPEDSRVSVLVEQIPEDPREPFFQRPDAVLPKKLNIISRNKERSRGGASRASALKATNQRVPKKSFPKRKFWVCV
tara:strand:- start:4257 stop:4538 length:282 start_codon:yes stop_codon:yes gene_type:complete